MGAHHHRGGEEDEHPLVGVHVQRGLVFGLSRGRKRVRVEVLEVLAMLGSVPVIFAGDFNVKLETSSAISHARRIDTCKLCASSQGLPEPDPTCFFRSTSEGSRIDALLSNGAARSMLGEAGVS